MKGSSDGFTAQIGRISMEWVQVKVAIVIDCQGTRCPSGDSETVLISLILQGETFCYLLHCALRSVSYITYSWQIGNFREIGLYMGREGSRSMMPIYQLYRPLRGQQQRMKDSICRIPMLQAIVFAKNPCSSFLFD